MSRNKTTKFNERPTQKIYRRETPPVPSADHQGCNTNSNPRLHYTGTYVIGIGQMHKSNAIPITNGTSAVDIAKMRRN